MRPILLARHGQTAWNAARRLQGQSDIPLDDTGRDQARALAARLAGAGITAVWTSDLARARETGSIIAAALGLAAPTADPALRERHYGIFEGLTRDDILAHHADAWHAWNWETGAPPGGELGTAVTARITGALRRIADGAGGDGAGGDGAGGDDAGGDGAGAAVDATAPALVISHGAAMRLFLMSILGPSVPIIANTVTYVIEHDATGVRARLLEPA